MTAELRLTTGEIAFAVGVVASLRRALDIVRDQLGVTEPERAQMVIAASGQSLLARELATQVDRDVRLVPEMQTAAEVMAGAEWLLRCARVTGSRSERLLFQLGPTGILAHVVDGEHVHRVSRVAGAGALIERTCGWFDLAPIEPRIAPVRFDRSVLDELGALPDAARLDRELTLRGVPADVSTPFATDLATARWRGGVSLVHCPKGQPASAQVAFLIVAGARTWVIDLRDPAGATLAEASRDQFGAGLAMLLATLDSTTRKAF